MKKIEQYATNQVIGVKGRYIPILKYNLPIKKIKEDIVKLINLYGLSTFYLFKYDEDNAIYAVCLDSLSQRRIEKIQKASKSVNSDDVKKYKKTVFPLMNAKYLGKLESVNNKIKSKAMVAFIRVFDNVSVNSVHGNYSLKMIYVVKEVKE